MGTRKEAVSKVNKRRFLLLDCIDFSELDLRTGGWPFNKIKKSQGCEFFHICDFSAHQILLSCIYNDLLINAIWRSKILVTLPCKSPD